MVALTVLLKGLVLNDFLNTLTRWMVRLVLLAVGIVFFLSLLSVAVLLAAVWGVRALWAKLTGRTVAPWVMPMRGASSWAQMYQRAGSMGARSTETDPESASQSPAPFTPAAGSKRGGILSKVAGEVSDVQVREVTER